MSDPTSTVPEGRRAITLDELAQIRKGPNVNTTDLQVKGVITIFDKDGNVKSKLDIVALDPDEEI